MIESLFILKAPSPSRDLDRSCDSREGGSAPLQLTKHVVPSKPPSTPHSNTDIIRSPLPLSVAYFRRTYSLKVSLHSRSVSISANRTIVVVNSRLRRYNNTDSPSSCEIPSSMSLPSIKPLVRVLLRTGPDELAKINPSLDQADTQLIEKVYAELHITGITKVRRLIIKL